ncbi:MAG: hypothetical protein U1E14_03475 [Geminicoccaceae bacterium]
MSAENRPAGRPRLASPRPITAWAEPYIGELSTIAPPPAKKARITAVHSSCSTGSSPTLKVIQLPRPTAGMGSPLDGMTRVATPLACAGRAAAAATPMAPASSPRRVVRIEAPPVTPAGPGR